MIGKCEMKVPSARPGRLRQCRVTPAIAWTLYRDNEPWSQTWRCADHEPGFHDGSRFRAERKP